MREVYGRGEKDHRTAGLQIRQYGHHGEAAGSRRNRNIGSLFSEVLFLTVCSLQHTKNRRIKQSDLSVIKVLRSNKETHYGNLLKNT